MKSTAKPIESVKPSEPLPSAAKNSDIRPWLHIGEAVELALSGMARLVAARRASRRLPMARPSRARRGVDLIECTRRGEYWAIQYKFRSERDLSRRIDAARDWPLASGAS
jgi:hypothetical protein